MEMVLPIETAQSPVVLRRNWFSGKFVCEERGTQVVINSPTELSTHFNLRLKRTYVVRVGTEPKTELLIEHERPLLFAAFRPHSYRVSVEGRTVCQYRGY